MFKSPASQNVLLKKKKIYIINNISNCTQVCQARDVNPNISHQILPTSKVYVPSFWRLSGQTFQIKLTLTGWELH